MKIYVASKVKHAPMWRELRARGWPINSTWIDEAGEGETKSRRELADRCIREAADCDALILYCEPGDLLKGALIEAGAALAHGKPILCVGQCGSLGKTFSHHPCCTAMPTINDALAHAWAWCGQPPAQQPSIPCPR